MVGLIAIDGPSDCPDPAAVARELEPLAAAAASGSRGPAHVRLRRDPDALVIEERGPAGEPRAARRLALGPSCADLAAAAAVVIASWQTSLPGAASYDELTIGTALVARPPARRRLDVVVGGAFVASFAPAFAAGAAVDATLAPRGRRWAGRLALSGSGTRDLALAGGSAAWTRVGVALGPALRLARGRWQLDLHAEAVAALLYTAGQGYAHDHTALAFDPGLGGGVRGAVRVGPVAPFIGVGVVGWLRPQEVVMLDGEVQSRRLPAVELLVSAGLAIGNFR
jgi:hypothetical protein